MGRTRTIGLALLSAAVAALGVAADAGAGGGDYTQMAPVGGVALVGSPYRFETFVLGQRHRVTVVERIDRRRGLISRRWELRGAWHMSAPAYDGEGVGVAAEAPLLVLTRYGSPRRSLLRAHTHLAFLDTGPHRLHGPSPFTRAELPGDYTVQAISPNGEFVYLAHNLSASPTHGPRFVLVPYSLRARKLLPANDIAGNGEVLSGTPVARTEGPVGRRVFTLYMDYSPGRRMYLRVLDAVHGRLAAIELTQLRGTKNPLLLDLHLSPSGRFLTIRKHSSRHWAHRETVVARIDLRRRLGAVAERLQARSPAPTDPVGSFERTVGESRQGRPIELREVGDLALPMGLLVFACIHGDECGAEALEPLREGCPDAGAHVDVVANLDPDGSAAHTRLNAQGVDLNRNFAAGWRPIGRSGDLEYSGPKPFSEPETRLAARLIRHLEPRVTIWFHQHWGDGSFVRAWGPSVPAARRFARVAGLGFRLLRWPAGTAPNWQNRRFPGSASFVVELPRGKLPQPVQIRLDEALGRFGEEVGENPRVARRG